MPDITMCKGDECKVKDTCYRYTAKPNEFRQSFFWKPPGNDKTCEYFYKVDKVKNRK